jgi:hypothetical protein
MKTKFKIIGLQILGLSFTVAPILTIIAVNWEKYTTVIPGQVIPETIKLTAGAIVGVTLAILASIGKLKLSGGWIFLGIMFALTWALQAIIADLVLFLGVAFAGSTVDYIFIKGAVANLKETKVMTKQADINADSLARALAKELGGRV